MDVKRSNIIAVSCLVLALALNFGFSEWGVRHETVRWHGHVSTEGPSGVRVFVPWETGFITKCIATSACQVLSASNSYGLFARPGVPFDVALGGGLIIPSLLICFAIDCLLRKRISPTLFWSAAFATSAGFMITGGLGYGLFPYIYDNYLGPHRIFGPSPVYQYDVPMEEWGIFALGFVLLVVGVWLWRLGIKKSAT